MTPGPRPIVIDPNILFSALLDAGSNLGKRLFEQGEILFICETTLTELFRRKERLVQRTTMDDAALAAMYGLLVKHVNLYKEAWISSDYWQRARDLCADLDPDDAPQVALTLALDGLLWTGDKRLRDGLLRKGFDRFFVR